MFHSGSVQRLLKHSYGIDAGDALGLPESRISEQRSEPSYEIQVYDLVVSRGCPPHRAAWSTSSTARLGCRGSGSLRICDLNVPGDGHQLMYDALRPPFIIRSRRLEQSV